MFVCTPSDKLGKNTFSEFRITTILKSIRIIYLDEQEKIKQHFDEVIFLKLPKKALDICCCDLKTMEKVDQTRVIKCEICSTFETMTVIFTLIVST